MYVIRPGWNGWIIRERGTGKKVGRADNKIQAMAMVKEKYETEKRRTSG